MLKVLNGTINGNKDCLASLQAKVWNHFPEECRTSRHFGIH